MDVVSPPHYRRLFSSPGQSDELPAYTRRNTLTQSVARRDPTEHVFVLTEKNRPWVTLKLYSSAKSSKSLPTFFEKENIKGSLEIDADRGDSIQSVTAVVTGRIITGANTSDSFTFLSQSLPIWAKSADIPRVTSPSERASSNKLLGHCQWPLSIHLPRNVTVPSSQGVLQTYRLPETFLERHTSASIQYDFAIRISRGRLRSDAQLTTAFGYVPSTRPDPPSLLRQLAYQEISSIPGPESDPDGWKTLSPFVSRGVLSQNRAIGVQCTLSLAKPLCYARGSVIPCSVKVECDDWSALDLFAAPTAIAVHLQRQVRYFRQPSYGRAEVAWNESVADMGAATWWPSPNYRRDPSARYLDGEIKLAKDLRPTSAVAHFKVAYSVVLRPFQVAHFCPDMQGSLSEPVEIATMHAKGPRPHAYSPPAYEPMT